MKNEMGPGMRLPIGIVAVALWAAADEIVRATDGRDIRLRDDGTYEPVFTIADIPPVAPPSLGVTQPAIYYGEEDSGYRIVNP